MEPPVNPPELRPRKTFAHALFDFICMSRGHSHSRIVRNFVEQIIERSDICEQGSILVYNPAHNSLKLYDQLKANNINSIIDFPSSDFSTNEGLAGLVFRKKAPEYVPDCDKHPEFQPVKGQDIHTIYCLPILLDCRPEPFGVASFHNSKTGGELRNAPASSWILPLRHWRPCCR